MQHIQDVYDILHIISLPLRLRMLNLMLLSPNGMITVGATQKFLCEGLRTQDSNVVSHNFRFLQKRGIVDFFRKSNDLRHWYYLCIGGEFGDYLKKFVEYWRENSYELQIDTQRYLEQCS